MSCRGCTKKYGLFLKEVGCPKCKFSYCKNCIKYSIDGSPEKRKLKVCLSCFNAQKKSSTEEAEDGERPVPEAYLKRIEKLGSTAGASQGVAQDDEIMKRLEKLREDRQPKSVPSEEEMRKRLAELRGQQYKEYSNAHVFAVDKRSDQQKMDDLMKQYSEEASIREAFDPAKDVEKRLAALKKNPLPSSGSSQSAKAPEAAGATANVDEESEDEEIAAKKLAQRYLAESALEGEILDPDEKEFISSLPPPSGDTEELPWCTVCNEDASIRCLGCDGELFCRECFKDIHDDEEYRAHRTKPYHGKKE
ncbi:abscission/NoCut checkpoint regulator [Phlebotomus argentipes]|uniref:abscission/NoCut checkpoint regulator n=1 Tax=Phlebotomus argentipes TaxID=94469 RepID=UPI0028934DF1|nr:abscission/NoCut checkpoint regulator [Phlebotomus argentipes]